MRQPTAATGPRALPQRAAAVEGGGRSERAAVRTHPRFFPTVEAAVAAYRPRTGAEWAGGPVQSR
ncbi:hypothetical protein [Streptomyces sp. NPDC001348]